jgi:hypothetical protein
MASDGPQNILLALCMNANIVRPDDSTLSGNVPNARRIISAAKAMMIDDPNFEEKIWDSNISTICFQNGLWDFKRKKFFAYEDRKDVFPVFVINRDFPTTRPSQDLMDEVYERLLLSTLGDSQVVKTYLELIARGVAGEYTDKQWAIMFGERNCGKGVLQEVNKEAWGPYVNTINANSFLLQSSTTDSAKALSWAVDCQFTRLTYTNEVKCDGVVKLDGNLIKGFQSAGDMINARKNYMDEKQFRVATKLIMNLNDIPEVTPRDAITSMILVKFPFKFVQQEELNINAAAKYLKLADNYIKTNFCKRQDVIDAFIWLVIEAYKDGPVVPCEKVTHDMMGYREDVGDDSVLMAQHFEVTGDRKDFVLVRELKTFLRSMNVSMTKGKDRLKRMGAWEDKNCCVGGVVHGRGLMGVRFIIKDDDSYI